MTATAAEALAAVEADKRNYFCDTDHKVAAALASGTTEVPGLTEDQVNESINLLLGPGYAESVSFTPCFSHPPVDTDDPLWEPDDQRCGMHVIRFGDVETPWTYCHQTVSAIPVDPTPAEVSDDEWVDGGDWLDAISDHGYTTDTHVTVGFRILLMESFEAGALADTIASEDGLTQITDHEVNLVVQDLITYGFLVHELSIGLEPGVKERMLRFQIPQVAA